MLPAETTAYLGISLHICIYYTLIYADIYINTQPVMTLSLTLDII